ncbi:MAG: shikimate dehydrogenase [bacterium]
MKPVEKYGNVAWVAGSPIDHSLSPVIHNSAFEGAGLPHQYFAIEVKPEELTDFVGNLQSMGMIGANFTLPLKNAVCEVVEDQTPAVETIGAANTLFRRNSGEFALDNTDVYGFEKLVEPWGERIRSEPVLILGAGGASRACLFALDRLNCPRIYLWNRTRESAQTLSEQYPYDITVLSDSELSEGEFEAGVVVNTTSLGLNESDGSPFPEQQIRDDMVGVDLIYNRETKFVQDFGEYGSDSIGGLGMLVHQAAGAWKRWFDTTPNVDIMKQAALDYLQDDQ